MFGAKKQEKVETNSVTRPSSPQGAATSTIDKDMSIVGDVTFKGKTRLNGKIEGNIHGDYLIISKTGNIVGDIWARVVECQGKIEGNIKAEKVIAQNEAVLHGSIEAVDLAVESGAKLTGDIKAPTSGDLHLVDSAANTESQAKTQVNQ